MKPSRLLVFAFLLERALMPGQNMTNQIGSETGLIHEDLALTAVRNQKLLEKDSANIELNYQMGYCYLKSRSQKNKALPYLQKAFGAGKTDPAMHRLLADAWFASEDFDQAATHYRLCRQKLAQTGAPFFLLNDIDHRLELCRMGQEIKDLKKTLTAVTSVHYSNTGSQADASTTNEDVVLPLNAARKTLRKDGAFFSDEEIVSLQEEAKYPDQDTVSHKEATVATSFDGQIMLIYRNDEGRGNLYLSMLDGNDWTVPDLVNRQVNVTGWEQDEYISSDGNTLYFTSDRAGGYGGKDIYKCTKTADGEWSKAVNLGAPVNTPYDEVAPCILPDGGTLYFSSNRYRSKSNFDIYMTTYADSGKWRIPLSVGYPVKKEKPTQKSERAPEKDSYLVTFNATKAIPITLLRGKLSDEKNNLPQSAEITVTDNVSGDIMGIYHPDETSGHYNLLLAPGKNNNVTFDASGYLFHSENIDLTGEPSLYKVVEPTVMKPFMENSREILNNVFFASKSTTFQPSSLPELQKLHLFLKNNPGCRIELGCAGMAVDDSENGRLAGARARAVAGYLLDKGIEKERVVTHAYAAKKKHRKKRAPTIALANTEKIEIKITDIK